MASGNSSVTALQGTNDQSIVSKRSACRAGYFDDDHLRKVVNKFSKRTALINRGYWLRVHAVRALIQRAIELKKSSPVQIVFLGAGFDTAGFIALENAPSDCNVRVVEIDLPDVVQRKSSVIRSDPALSQTCGWTIDEENSPPSTGQRRYEIAEFDLRNPVENLGSLFASFDLKQDAFTIVVAECVLCYVPRPKGDQVISYCCAYFRPGGVMALTYEQIRVGTGGFGNQMKDKLESQGSPLSGTNDLPNISKQKERYLRLGYQRVSVATLSEIYHKYLPSDTLSKIENLESFDEHEEWLIKCSHYFVLAALSDETQCPKMDELWWPEQPTTTDTEVNHHSPSSNKFEVHNGISSSINSSSINADEKKAECISLKPFLKTAGRWGHCSEFLDHHRLFVFGGYGPLSPLQDANASAFQRSPQSLIIDTLTGHAAVHAIGSASRAPGPRMYAQSVSVPRILSTHSSNGGDSSDVDRSSQLYHHQRNMILIGGRTSPHAALMDVWILDSGSMQWHCLHSNHHHNNNNNKNNNHPLSSQDGTDVPVPRWRHSVCHVQTTVVALANTTTSDPESSANPSFHATPSASFDIVHEMFMFGGRTYDESAHSFDSLNDLWRVRIRLPCFPNRHTGTAHQLPIAAAAATVTTTTMNFDTIGDSIDWTHASVEWEPLHRSLSISSPAGPAGRSGASLTAFADRTGVRRTLLVGGFNEYNRPLGDVWAFSCSSDGGRWERQSTGGCAFPPRGGHQAVLGADGDSLSIIGGVGLHGEFDDSDSLNRFAFVLDLSDFHWDRILIAPEDSNFTVLASHIIRVPPGSSAASSTATANSRIPQPLYIVGGGIVCFSFGTTLNAIVTRVAMDCSENGGGESSTSESASSSTPVDRIAISTKSTGNSSGSQESVTPSMRDSPSWSDKSVPSSIRIVRADEDADEIDRLIAERVPFIIRHGIDTLGPSARRWCDWDYLKSTIGDTLISTHECRSASAVSAFSQVASADLKNAFPNQRYAVCMDFTTRNFTFVHMKIRELIDKVRATEGTPKSSSTTFSRSPSDSDSVLTDQSVEHLGYYLRTVGENPRKQTSDLWSSFPQIASDIQWPPKFLQRNIPDVKDRYHSSVFRIASPWLQLWTHYDIMDNVLFQFTGRKRVYLWHPNAAVDLEIDGSSSPITFVDDPETAAKHPRFHHCPRVECTLEAGDALFLPALWFHNVLSLDEASLSLNVFWRHLSADEYSKKDLYGNRDISSAELAKSKFDEFLKALANVPPIYREFYATQLEARFSDAMKQ